MELVELAPTRRLPAIRMVFRHWVCFAIALTWEGHRAAPDAAGTAHALHTPSSPTPSLTREKILLKIFSGCIFLKCCYFSFD